MSSQVRQENTSFIELRFGAVCTFNFMVQLSVDGRYVTREKHEWLRFVSRISHPKVMALTL